MKILALDTSTEYCSVALSIDGVLDEREMRAGQRHSELVLGRVDALLRARGVQLRDLDAIAFGEGPGSFTGLRIACGVVQGLAFGADVPVVGVGTLLAMAYGSGAERVVCCLDARMHEIYHAAYRRVINPGGERTEGNPRFPSVTSFPDAHWAVVHEPSVCAPAVAPVLDSAGWLGCGSGFTAYRDALEARYAGRLSAVEPERFPRARDIAVLGAARFEAGLAASAEHAAPLYIRDKVALTSDERAAR